MPGPDREAKAAVAARDATLTKPAGALGRLESLVSWLAAWQGKAPPSFDRPLVCVFAGSHGVTRTGRLGLPGRGQPADARQFRGGRGGDQPDLRGLRPRLQGVRPRPRHAHRRHHGRPPRSTSAPRSPPWRSAWRRWPPAPTASASARWASATPRWRPPSTPPCSAARPPIGSGAAPAWTGTACPGRSRPWRRRSPTMPAISTIRSRCWRGSAAGRSPPWPGRSWRRGCSASRW